MVDVLKASAMKNVSFLEALAAPLGFKIPVTLELAEEYPEIFTVGLAEYSTSIEFWVEHTLVGDTETTVTSLNQAWLGILQLLGGVTVYQNAHHSSSSKAGLRPDSTCMRNDILVLKEEAKDTVSKLDMAQTELHSKMHSEAFKCFPSGQLSIPGLTTCPTRVKLFSVEYDARSSSYSCRPTKTYEVQSKDARVAFIVDVFKLLKWIIGIAIPNAHMHLVPGVRIKTGNNHCVTWTKSGLLKEFHRLSLDRIPFNLIRKVYDANLPCVEKGFVNCSSITITSVGILLERAMQDRPTVITRTEVLRQIRTALDGMHSIDIAHCDVCRENIFVLDDNEIILGDLEYCRNVSDIAPDVRRRYDKELGHPRNAKELDEQQFLKLSEKL